MRSSGIAAAALTLLAVLLLAGCGQSSGTVAGSATPIPGHSSASGSKVTFVELGSVDCVPCKEMQPVMKAIERTFGEQVDVVFYDVWQDSAPAEQYGISMIPTQVFLDEDGREFHRHVGFYPEEEIVQLLVDHGLEKLATPTP